MTERFTRQQLYDLVWSKPATESAAGLGVSDVWLSKVCRQANVPRPPRGYWAKLRSGQQPAQIPLPDAEPKSKARIVLSRRSPRPDDDQQRRVRALASTAGPVKVPARLRDIHTSVDRTLRLLESAAFDDSGRTLLGNVHDAFNVRVTPQLVPRVLRLLQAVCDEAKRRGWEINSRPLAYNEPPLGTRVQIGRQNYELSVEEKTKPIPFTEDDIQRWKARRWSDDDRQEPPAQLRRRRPTGELTLRIPSAWDHSQSTWSDGKRQRVEDKLHELFATLVVRAATDEERQQQHEKEQEAEFERRQLARLERAQIMRLDEDIQASERADQIRRYVAKIRQQLCEVPHTESERLAAWCDWASGYADRIDPTSTLDLIVGLEEEEDW